MGEEVKCHICGFERTKPWPRRIPSFWSPASGFGLEEYVHACIEARLPMFDPRLHRNQGYQGSGKCKVIDCAICEMMRRHGS